MPMQPSCLETDSTKLAPISEPPPPADLPPEAPHLIAGDLAHELNNILSIIQGYADRLVLKHGSQPELRAELKLISNNARRAASVIRLAKPRNFPAVAPVG